MRPDTLTEATFRGWVVTTATAHGWLVHETEEANGGAPNVWLVRAGEVLAVRVKSERAKETDAQARWMHELEATRVESAVWRPSQMDAVYARLTAAPRLVEEAA